MYLEKLKPPIIWNGGSTSFFYNKCKSSINIIDMLHEDDVHGILKFVDVVKEVINEVSTRTPPMASIT